MRPRPCDFCAAPPTHSAVWRIDEKHKRRLWLCATCAAAITDPAHVTPIVRRRMEKQLKRLADSVLRPGAMKTAQARRMTKASVRQRSTLPTIFANGLPSHLEAYVATVLPGGLRTGDDLARLLSRSITDLSRGQLDRKDADIINRQAARLLRQRKKNLPPSR